MRSFLRLPVVIVSVLSCTGPAAAQHCFRDGPPDRCRTVTVVEFGGLHAFENALRATNVNTGFWEAGLLVNRGDARTALGGSLYLSYDEESYRNMVWALKARLRRRLTRALSVDLSAGPIVAIRDTDPWIDPRLPGVTTRATLNLADWVGVTAGFDAYDLRISDELPPIARERIRDERWSWFVGAQAEGYLGVVGGVAGAALVIVANAIRD